MLMSASEGFAGDVRGSLGPHKGGRVRISLDEVSLDVTDEGADRLEGASADRIAGQNAEPRSDQIQPSGLLRGEMKMDVKAVAWPRFPALPPRGARGARLRQPRPPRQAHRALALGPETAEHPDQSARAPPPLLRTGREEPRSHRWRVTAFGHRVKGASVRLRRLHFPAFLADAA